MVPVRGLFVEETAHPVSAGAASPGAAGGRGWAANQNCSPWVLGLDVRGGVWAAWTLQRPLSWVCLGPGLRCLGATLTATS